MSDDYELAVQLGERQAREVIGERDASMDAGRREALAFFESYRLPSPPVVPSEKRAARGERRPNGGLVAEGDSWFDYPGCDILSALGDRFGFEIETVAHRGDRIEDMAYSQHQLHAFTQRIEAVIRRGDAPRAILLSGGGNDIAGPELAYLLNHSDSPQPGLNSKVLEGVIYERLRHCYITVIAAVTAVC